MLEKAGVSVISTGGTAKKLVGSGIKAKEVEEITHFPEILEGRVKTLHPHIHGGLLATPDQESHVAELEKHKINPIQLVYITILFG